MLQNRQAFKYQVNFYIHRVTIAIKFDCKMQIVLKKGKKKVKTETFKPYNLQKRLIEFGDCLKFESIYIKDKKTGKFLDEENKN